MAGKVGGRGHKTSIFLVIRQNWRLGLVVTTGLPDSFSPELNLPLWSQAELHTPSPSHVVRPLAPRNAGGGGEGPMPSSYTSVSPTNPAPPQHSQSATGTTEPPQAFRKKLSSQPSQFFFSFHLLLEVTRIYGEQTHTPTKCLAFISNHTSAPPLPSPDPSHAHVLLRQSRYLPVFLFASSLTAQQREGRQTINQMCYSSTPNSS